jgi:hypothetical protein
MRILLTLTLLVALNSFGQDTAGRFRLVNDTPRMESVLSSKEISFCIVDSLGNNQKVGFVINKKDSTFYIDGDTVELLKQLVKFNFQRTEQLHKDIRQLQNTIKSGVNFLNDLPEYFKSKTTNPSWPEYWEALFRQGYKFRRKEIVLPDSYKL